MVKQYWAVAFGAALAGLTAGPAWAQADDKDEWTSFYIGAQATGSSDSVDAGATLQVQQVSNLFVTGRGIIVVPGLATSYAASDRDTGITAGGFAGYQRQWNNVVVGIEGDFTPLRRTVSAAQSQTILPTALTPAATVVARRDVQLDDRWSARLRLGYAAGKTLVYATGGYAQTRARVTSIDSFFDPGGAAATCGIPNCQTPNFGPSGPVVTTASASRWLSGWTAGAGIEHKLGTSLSIGLEYRRTDLGGKTFTPTNGTVVNSGATILGQNGQPGLSGQVDPGPTRVKVKSDALSLRLAFHF